MCVLFPSLRQSGAPSVQLAIEEGHDLSPWMSAIMAAAVRRSSTYRPISPLENAFSIEQAQEMVKSPYGYMRINIQSNDDEDGGSSTYEVPVEYFSVSTFCTPLSIFQEIQEFHEIQQF